MAQPRVAVVGAGLAGLSAAVELADAGIAVDLFERSRLLGGRATSFVVNGREVDNGQHVFLACCTEFIDFVRRLGLADLLVLQRRFEALMIRRDGRTSRLRAARLPAPWHLAASLVGFRLMSLGARTRVAKAMLAASLAFDRRSIRNESVAFDRRSMTARPEVEQSFAQWLQSRGQQAEELQSFWEPFFVPALNAPLDRVSASDALMVLETAFLRDAGAARFGYAKVPLAHFAAAAAKRVDSVHLSTPVMAIEFDAGESQALGLVISGGGRSAFDAVILALTPPQLARLLGDDSRRLGLPALDAFAAYPIVDVHLWHDAGAAGFEFACLVGSPVQWVFEKGAGYLCCSISAAGEFLTMPTERLEQLCWKEVTSSIAALKNAKLIDAAVTRNPDATYLPTPNVERPGNATMVSNVAVAGSWTDTGWPDTMESAVRSGRAAARHILKFVAGPATRVSVGELGSPTHRPSVERYSASPTPSVERYNTNTAGTAR